jgi:transportin-3
MQQQQQQQQELPPPSENLEEELVRILQALDVVYSPQSTSQSGDFWTRQVADRYLVRFQSTSIAWMVCDRLLSNPAPPVRFFASQTLHNKCQCDVQQLPSDSLPSLRDSLMQHLKQADNGPYKTQLGLAIAALAVQMNWTTVIQDLASSPEHGLIICQVLPEECSSSRLILEDDTLRYMMEDALLSNAKQVLAYPSFELWFTWIRYLPLPAELLVEANIVPACLAALHQAQNEVAVDVLVELIRLYPSHVPRNQVLVHSILPLVMQLPLEQALLGDDEDVQRAFCRIFTELGESYLSILLEQDGQAILTKVTQCTSIADNSISGMTHNFWYRFVMELEQMDDYRKRQDQVDHYTPHLLQLLDVCLVHLEYPQDEEISDDLIDDFHRERFYLGETMEDCCRLMGGNMVLERIGMRLSSSHSNWKSVEACLYAMQPLAKYIPHDENEFMPQCFALLQQLPTDIEPLRFTVSIFVGKYAQWLASHREHLTPLLPYLAEGLSVPKCSNAAAVAIKNLCEQIPLGDSVLTLYNQVGGKIELNNELEILEGLCKGIAENQVATYLPQIVQPIGARLQEALQANSSSSKEIFGEIDRLTVAMRFLKMPPATLMEMLHTSWQLLEAAGQKHSSEALMAEKLCRLHKHALRTCGVQFYTPMLPNLMTMIVQFFDLSHQAPYLYLASIVVTEYPRHPELINMMKAMCTTAFSFLTSSEVMTSHPDVVEELFYCMGRMIKHCPEPLVNTGDLLSSLVRCALVGIELDHRDANRGTLNFLQHLVTYGLEHRNEASAVLATIQQTGPEIVDKLVRALMGELPAYCLDGGSGSISGILFQLNQLAPHEFQQQWLVAALQRAPERPRNELLAATSSRRTGNSQVDFDMAVRSFKAASERYRKLNRQTSQ